MEALENRTNNIQEAMRDRLGDVRKSFMKEQERKCLGKFKVGDLVMCCTPGISDKLEKAWEGPFKVIECIGPVNYCIDIGIGGRKKGKVVHVNILKKWERHDTIIRRVVFAEEYQSESCHSKVKLTPRVLDDVQNQELDMVLGEYALLFDEILGSTDKYAHAVDVVQGSSSIHSGPYACESRLEKR